MVTLNRIYTRAGDAGATRLANGRKVSKADPRVEAYGAVDEANACLGLARLHTAGAGALDDALDCVSRGIPILDAPGFAERDVYWPVCFNFGWVLDVAGRRVEAEQMRARPYKTGWRNRSSNAYWAWRYGEVADADTELPYLHTFAYHPTALSHWQLDREAVATLSGGSPR